MAERSTPELLGDGGAFADLAFWRKVAVSGEDAFRWLDDLVTADLSALAPGRARQTLFLSPTGGVRALFTVAMTDESGEFLLVQDPSQPTSIQDLLDRYVLSSDVALKDRTGQIAIFAFPGRTAPPEVAGATAAAPSCLGAGIDLLVAMDHRDAVLDALSRTYAHAGNEDVEAWQIAAGIPRFGIDAQDGDLPQECGLSDLVSRGKGCFPGQEAVAKVDNLGHPRRLLMALEAPGVVGGLDVSSGQAPAEVSVSPGSGLDAGGRRVGEVTSVAAVAGRTYLLARVAWDARDAELTTSGIPLRARSGASLVD